MTAGTDWRFLLPPDPIERLSVAGGPASVAELLRREGAADEVRETVGERVDAVAVLYGSPVPLEEAVAQLTSDGWLYWEADERPTLRSARAAIRRSVARLRAAGLCVVGVWAVWPNFDRPIAYVPAEALGWFARTIHPTRTREERTRGMVLRLLAPLGAIGAAVVTPCFAFTAVRGRAPRVRSTVLLTHGPERAILLPFPPDRLIKVPRTPEYAAKTLAEQATLARVRARLDPETASAIPEPLGIIPHGRVTAGVERYLPGRSLVHGRGSEEDLGLASDWLTRFHLQTLDRREAWSGEEVERAFSAWENRPGTTPAERRLLKSARTRSRELLGLPFPIVWQHRDFTPWNLLREGSRLAVLDWEGARPGLALCDLLHFVGHRDELASGAVAPEERVRAFAAGSASSRTHVARYCERLGIDSRFVPLLLAYTRVEIALRSPCRTLDADYVSALADRSVEIFSEEVALAR